MIRFTLKHCVVLLVCLLALGSTRVLAQGASGAIEGQVVDAQQLPLPGVAVAVLNAQGNAVTSVINLNDGHYRVERLPDGMYMVEFSRDGFATFRKTGVAIAGGQTVTVNAALQPQALTSTVTVTAQVDDQNVGSKTDIPASALPVTVEEVPRDLINQQASTEIVSVINNLPAANAWTEYGALNYFEFRGQLLYNDPGSAVLLNGIPIQGNRSDSQVNSVESVDVLKGPASMLYGTQDPGGTINIVEKQPLAESQQELVLHGGYWGTNGVEFGTTGPLTKSGNLLYRVDLGYIDSSGFRGDAYKKLNLSPKLFWRITPKDRLRLNFSWNDDHFAMDSGIPLLPSVDPLTFPASNTWSIPSVNINTRYNTPGNFEKLNSPIFQAFYEHDFNDNITLRSSTQFQYGTDEYWQNELNAIDISTGPPYTVLRGPSANPETFSLFFYHRFYYGFNQDDIVGSFHLFGWKHQYMVGYELDQLYHKTQRSDDAEDLAIPPETLMNPVETSGAVTNFPASSYDGLRYWQNAVYFQDFINIHPKFQVLVGGRYDGYYNYNFEYDPNGSGGFTYSTSNAFPQHPFTYRVGVVSPLTPITTLYANWSTSFTAQTEVSTAGNPLKPETGQQIEAGARFRFAQGRINLNVDYFHIVESNVAESRPDGVIFQATGTTSYGGEAELRARVTPKFNVYATYGITHSAFDTFIVPTYYIMDADFDPWGYQNLAGYTPPLVPKVTQRLWATYQLPKGFLLMVGDRYVSKRGTDIYDLFWMPGFITFDAGLTYRRARMEYSVNLMNITNRTYWVAAIDDTEIYPGQPFNIVATARFHFGKE